MHKMCLKERERERKRERAREREKGDANGEFKSIYAPLSGWKIIFECIARIGHCWTCNLELDDPLLANFVPCNQRFAATWISTV